MVYLVVMRCMPFASILGRQPKAMGGHHGRVQCKGSAQEGERVTRHVGSNSLKFAPEFYQASKLMS